MVIVKNEFRLLLEQIATERGISSEDVLTSIESAILIAFRKNDITHHNDESVRVVLNRDTGESKVFNSEDLDITPPTFGRIAAQTAKQVILQKIKEAEKKAVMSQYKTQVGSIVKGRVLRFDGRNIYFDIGKTEGVLAKEDQIRGEQYHQGNQYSLYIREIKEDANGRSHILLSRSSEKFLEELFRREVPEIATGTVKIKKIVREPGERSKVAVYSVQSGVDPIGSCVGQKGIRVQTITSELGEREKIDIIQWSDDPKILVAMALAPAKLLNVIIHENEKRADVEVEESQVALAIGKNGVNVGLASELADYDIDIIEIKENKDKVLEDETVS